MIEALRCSRKLWVAMGISLAAHASAIAWMQRAWGGWQSSNPSPARSPQVLQVRWHKPGLAMFEPEHAWHASIAESSTNRTSNRSAATLDSSPARPSPWNADGMKLVWQPAGLQLPEPPVKYLDAASVDQIAQPIDVGMLSIPADDGAGHVIMILLVSADGRVDGATVEFSDLPDSFVEATLQAFRDTRFIPARQLGKAVPMRYRLEASFGYSVLNDERDLSQPVSSAEGSETR